MLAIANGIKEVEITEIGVEEGVDLSFLKSNIVYFPMWCNEGKTQSWTTSLADSAWVICQQCQTSVVSCL